MRDSAPRAEGHLQPDVDARNGWRNRYAVAAAGAILAGVAAASIRSVDAGPEVGYMAGIAVLMAWWWVFEVVPIPVTALLPLVLLPLLGIASVDTVAQSYGKPTIFLFLGGFILALGLQRSGLHRRIALRIVATIGGRPARLVLGFMLATALLSMWISNTAAVMVMLPIALSVLEEARAGGARGPGTDAGAGPGAGPGAVGVLGTAIMLAIAYAADIGGMATPVGTPPNLVLMAMMGDLFPAAPPIAFGQWMAMGLPMAAIFLIAGWLLLTRVIFRLPRQEMFAGGGGIRAALRDLGPLRRDEKLAGGIFAATALLWTTGSGLQLGASLRVPGWREALGLTGLGDDTVAIAGALALFIAPSRDRPGEALMDWTTAQRGVPWGILLLFGGGFALAAGFSSSGLSAAIGRAALGLEGLHPIAVLLIVCAVLTLLTELTSNTATTTLVLPILAQAAVALALDPRLLMIPATLSASCAFMMPVASPTQAIVFGSGYVSIRQMVRAGIWFNVLGVVLITAVFVLLGGPLLGVDLDVLPAWAR